MSKNMTLNDTRCTLLENTSYALTWMAKNLQKLLMCVYNFFISTMDRSSISFRSLCLLGGWRSDKICYENLKFIMSLKRLSRYKR